MPKTNLTKSQHKKLKFHRPHFSFSLGERANAASKENQKRKKKKRKEKEENCPIKLSGRPVKQVGTPLHKWG
jgi:hypothetical protein